MNERPTPETDALILSKEGFGATNYEWREHSRRLERERDEAREALSEAWHFADLWLSVADQYLKQINEWIRKN